MNENCMCITYYGNVEPLDESVKVLFMEGRNVRKHNYIGKQKPVKCFSDKNNHGFTNWMKKRRM